MIFRKFHLSRTNVLNSVRLVVLVFIYGLFQAIDSPFTFIPGLLLIFLLGNGLRRWITPAQAPFISNRFFAYGVDFMLGNFVLVLLTCLFSLAGLYYPVTLMVGFGLMIFLVLGVYCLRRSMIPRLGLRTSSDSLALLIILLGLFSIFIIRVIPEGWPSFPGLDHFHYMPTVYAAFEHGGLPFLYLNSSIFQPIAYYLHIGTLTSLLNTSFINLFFYGPLLTLPLYGLWLFSFAHTFFKHRGLAFLAGLLGMTVVGSAHFYGAHDIYSTSVTQLFFLYVWFYLYQLRPHLSSRVLVLLMASLYSFLMLVYPFTAIINLPWLALIIKRKKLRRVLFTALIALVIGAILFQGRAIFSEWSLSYFQEYISLRRLLILHSYSWVHLVLIGLSLVTVLFSKPTRQRLAATPLGPLSIYSLLLFLLFVSGYSHIASRLEWYFRSIVVLVSVLFFYPIVKASLTVRRMAGASLLLLFFIGQISAFAHFEKFSHGSLLIGPSIAFRLGQRDIGGAVSREEWAAFEWLRDNANPEDYIITDPYTGSLIRGSLDLAASSALRFETGEAPNVGGIGFYYLKELNYDFLAAISGELHQNVALNQSVSIEGMGDSEKSLESDLGASLVDEDEQTFVSSGQTETTYSIQLDDFHAVDTIKIVWGDESDIEEWSVDIKTETGWMTLEEIDPIESNESEIYLEERLSSLQIHSTGTSDHGIYEVYVYSRDLAIDEAYSALQTELDGLGFSIDNFLVFFDARTQYWLEQNESRSDLNRFAVWPIAFSEMNMFDWSHRFDILDWEVLYESSNLFILDPL